MNSMEIEIFYLWITKFSKCLYKLLQYKPYTEKIHKIEKKLYMFKIQISITHNNHTTKSLPKLPESCYHDMRKIACQQCTKYSTLDN